MAAKKRLCLTGNIHPPEEAPFAESQIHSLLVAGETSKSASALANLKRVCDEHLDASYRIKVVDLLKNPKLARDHQIVALPTLVRKLPQSMRKIIGDLSNTERVLVGLDIRSVEARDGVSTRLATRAHDGRSY